LLVVLASPAAVASDLTEVALYTRCYAHLTGRRVPFSDAELLHVRQGSRKAADACSALLDRTTLDDHGRLAPAGDAEKLVLNHFYEAYRSWFAVQRFEDAVPMNEFTRATYDVYDASTGALFLAYSLFGAGVPYGRIATQPNGVFALRALGGTSAYTTTGPYTRILVDMSPTPYTPLFQTGYKYDPVTHDENSLAPKQFWNPHTSPITVGGLVGITPFGVTSAGAPGDGPAPVPAILPSPFVDPFATEGLFSRAVLASSEPGFQGSIDIRQSLGPSGLIGTREYLMLNVGQSYAFRSDGALKLFRRWSKNVMGDLLCRDLPTLREGDVASFVVAGTGKDQTPPFRQSTTCLRCHATMDPMAYTLRNIRWANAAESDPADPVTDGYDTAHLSAYTPTADAPFTWSSAPVPGFHLQHPRGRLYYRSFTGALVDRTVSDLADLGAALSNSDDLYVCAARRHFRQFTGVDVSLHDMGDAGNALLNRAMTAKDREYRDFVIALGLRLKASGSIKEMIKEIVGSPYYAKSDYGKSEAPHGP
jgi:hypothetical protein